MGRPTLSEALAARLEQRRQHRAANPNPVSVDMDRHHGAKLSHLDDLIELSRTDPIAFANLPASDRHAAGMRAANLAARAATTAGDPK